MDWVRGKRFSELPWVIGGEKIEYAIRQALNGLSRSMAYYAVIAEDGRQIDRCAVVTRSGEFAQVKGYQVEGAEYTKKVEAK